jgi:spore coat protein A, manganese oxidase
MTTRRSFMKAMAITSAGFVFSPKGWLINSAFAQTPLLDPVAHPKFIKPLPIPQRIDTTSTAAVAKMKQGVGLSAVIQETKQKLGLFDAAGVELETNVWGYKIEGANLSYPGATLIAHQNNPALVRWDNQLISGTNLTVDQAHLLPFDTTMHHAMNMSEPIGIPTVVHLHGAHTEADSDGDPEAWFTNNYAETGAAFTKQTYKYDNDQEAATLWYHDHALGMTRLNVYAGLAGFYLIRDDNEKAHIKNGVLPSDPYEIEMVIQDKMFTADGQLFFPATNPDIEPINPLTGNPYDPLPTANSAIAEFFGDVILVNGMAWPVLDVEPRKYRFRLLNGSDSRFYKLKLDNNMPFLQIGLDQGFISAALNVSELLIMPGERVDLVLDFSAMANTEIVMQNIGPDGPFTGMVDVVADPATTGQVMKFSVNKPFNNGIPDVSVMAGTVLRQPITPLPQTGITRKLVLFEGRDQFGRLQPMLGTMNEGSMGWSMPVSEKPNLNDVEVWEIYNTTMDAHPIHAHLINFQVINRESYMGTVQKRPQMIHNHMGVTPPPMGVGGVLIENSIILGNDARPPEPNEVGLKDMVLAYPDEVTRIITSKFDRPGRYVWHCHILSHEDHDMMRPYEVINLSSPEVTLNLPVSDALNKNGYIEAVASTPSGSITKVEFYYGNTLLATSTAAPYRASWSNAPDGNYVLTAKAYASTGGVTISNPVQVIVSSVGSNNPPVITLKNPVGTNGNKTGFIEAVATDPDGTIIKVEFYYGSNLLTTVTSKPYRALWANVPNGSYDLTAKAYDNNGAVATSNLVTVVVNGK